MKNDQEMFGRSDFRAIGGGWGSKVGRGLRQVYSRLGGPSDEDETPRKATVQLKS